MKDDIEDFFLFFSRIFFGRDLQVRTMFLACLSGRGNPYLAAKFSGGSSNAAGICVSATLKLPENENGSTFLQCST